MSSSSSNSLSHVSNQSRDLLPMMGNLFSAVGASEIALHDEMTRTSQAVSQFVIQTNERLQTISERSAQLEARNTITAEAQRREAERMHLIQMQAIEQLTRTMNARFQEMGNRLEALENKMRTLESTLTKKLAAHTHNFSLFYIKDGVVLSRNYAADFGGSLPCTTHKTTTANLE